MNNGAPLPVNSLPSLLHFLRKLDFPHKKGVLDKIFKKAIIKKPLGWTKTWNGIPWLIDPAAHCHRWMIYDRYAESGFLKWAEKNVPDNGIIVDSGSNIGQFLPYYTKIVSKGMVYSFEPSAKLFGWILKCLDYNNIKNIKVFNKGLGNIDINAQLEAPLDESVHGLWGRVVETGGGEAICITTLAGVLSNENIQHIDLWKLDVEGYELKALQGALPFIEKRILKAAYIEMATTNRESRQIHEFMIANDFTPWVCDHFGIKPFKEFGSAKFDILYILK